MRVWIGGFRATIGEVNDCMEECRYDYFDRGNDGEIVCICLWQICKLCLWAIHPF